MTNIGNISLTSPYGIKEHDDVDAMDQYVIYQVLAFKMDTMLITGVLQEFQDNTDKMEEMSRMTRRWNAQMADMSEEKLAAGVYVDDDGNLVSNLTYLETEQDAATPFTDSIGHEATGPISRSLSFAYDDTTFHIDYTISGNTTTGFRYEFDITVGAHRDSTKSSEEGRIKTESWYEQTYELHIGVEENQSFTEAVATLMDYIDSQMRAHWRGNDNAKNQLNDNTANMTHLITDSIDNAYLSSHSNTALATLQLSDGFLDDHFSFQIGHTTMIVDYRLTYNELDDEYTIDFTNIQVGSHYVNATQDHSGYAAYTTDYAVETVAFTDDMLTDLNQQTSDTFQFGNQNSLEAIFTKVIEHIRAAANSGAFGSQKFREQVNEDFSSLTDLNTLFINTAYQDLLDSVYGASQAKITQPQSPSLMGHLAYTGLTDAGDEVNISAHYEIYGNEVQGYFMNLHATLSYEENGTTKTMQIELLQRELGQDNNLNDIMEEVMVMLKNQFRNLSGYNSDIFNYLKNNHAMIRNHLTGDLIESLGKNARSIDALFETTSLHTQYAIENSGLVEIPFIFRGLEHFFRIFWEYDTNTQVIKFDVYIRTAHSEGSGSKTRLVEGFELTTNPDESQAQFWQRALEKIFEEATQAFSQRIDNEKGNTNWEFFESLYGGNARRDRYVTGRDNIDVAMAFWSEKRDADYWETSHRDRDRGVQKKSAWKEKFNELNEWMVTEFTPERFAQMATSMPFVSFSGTDGMIEDAPYRPSRVGELLEEAIGDPGLYQNGRAYSKEHLTSILSRLDDIIANVGNLNNVVLQRIRRLQETATVRLQMIVQDLQREYQSASAIFNNMG